ncbi:phage tail protein [Acinetobacter sp. YH01005]|uniref:phage tail protein n=1 Tax=Acinetobacter sp. YH01005 TaxID=2601021 RepID=UPI0015D16573|nr:phage tail protein [Acinetobacter sp. YH01005]
MGKSSSQVVGYRYYAKFAAFIGNRIEKLIAINFDSRGWQIGKTVRASQGTDYMYIKKPGLYGENEGGVSGIVTIKTGEPNQTVACELVDRNGDLASAYPYQSYLTFSADLESLFGGINPELMLEEDLLDLTNLYDGSAGAQIGFYLGNSGYMKEMLLWPKRIHVRNDGRVQWYDEKAEIPKTSYVSRGSEYMPFSVSMNTICYSSAEDGVGFGEFTLPMYEQEISYGVKFLGGGLIGNGDPVGSNPSLFASASFIENKGLPAISGGTAIPSLDWKYDNFPKYDDYVFNSSAERKFKGSGNFYWGGGAFSYKAVTSGNNATLQIKKEGNVVLSVGASLDQLAWIYHEGELNLAAGLYQIEFDAGERYRLHQDPRPLIYFIVKLKEIKEIEHGDMNPIHKIREILTDDTAMNKPESDVNDINFMKAADRIWNEGLGISWSITEKSCLEAIEELCGHIEAGVRVNRQTGLYEMVLFRDDWFDENEIHTLAVNKIKSMSLEVANADEAINQLNVSYYNRDAIKDSSFSISENASIRNLQGRVNAEDADFPYFMNQRNAAVVAQWKLKQMSSPVWKGSFTTAEYNARKWNRYDLLKLAWPRKWQGTITVRIMKINLGTGADVSIDFVEVVPYSSNLLSDIAIDEPIDIAPQPPLPCQYEPFEMPYYLAVMALGQRQVDEELSYENNFGLVGVVAKQPQSNSLYAVMMTHDSTEGEEWVRAATINYEPTAELDQIISRTSVSFTVKDISEISALSIGTLIKCGSDWIGTPGEWMVFEGVDAYTGVVSVKRGALDSLPQDWGIGTKLYFCGNDVAYDSSEYVAGEEVLVSALTTTPSGMLENKGSIAIEMNARAIRPYPPANVKINGSYYPNEVNGNPILTWVNRNRIQQTGGGILGWFDGGVALEPGVTYQLIVTTIDALNTESEFLNVNVGTLNNYTIDLSTAPSSAKQFKIILKSIRDTYESLQYFEHIFVRPLSAPINLTATYNAF